ncbi:MAG TPA: DUF1189 family protein, partial [Longimicrobium sp.]|nr:DUF1189 family protein [Longimicrobium sp.]
EPHVIANPEDGKPLIVIDTTGATTEPPAAPSVLLTRDKLIVRQQNKMETHDLSQIQSFHVDGKRVQGWADTMLGGYWTLGFPLLVVFSFVLRLLQMLLFGVVALLVASSVRPPLGFAACMRLAALAMTPVILLDTLIWLTGLNVGCAWFLIAIGLEVTLLIFMVRANDDPRAEPPGGFAPAFGYAPPSGVAYPPQGYAPPAGYGAPAQGYPPAPPAPPSYTSPPPPPPRPGL